MKSCFPTLLILIALAGFALGWFNGRSSASASPHARLSSGGLASPSPSAFHAATFPSPDGVPPFLPPNEARVQTFQILTLPDRLERMHRFSHLLLSVTAENWRSVVDAFDVQRHSEGRIFREESDLLFARIGEVAGVTAIEEALNSKSRRDLLRVRGLVEGWAAADPQSAVAWLRARPAEQQPEYIRHLIPGLARSDPNAALKLVETQPSEIWRGSVHNIVTTAIQAEGIQRADEILAALHASTTAPKKLFQTFLSTLADQRRQIHSATGDTAALLHWLDPYFPAEPQTNGSDVNSDVLQVAIRAEPAGALRWLEARANRVPPELAESLYSDVAGTWASDHANHFQNWLTANPNHPQHRAIVSGAIAGLLERGKLPEARETLAAIRDPELVADLTGQIQAAEEKAEARKKLIVK